MDIGKVYIYGILYVCIRRLRYGYIVNNNILKYLDVVIFDKDNNLIIFLCVVWLYFIGCNG